MFEIITVSVLICVVVFMGWLLCDQRKASKAEVSDLLNRLMARDYPQYVQAEVMREEAKRVLTPEEIAEQQEERGIPV